MQRKQKLIPCRIDSDIFNFLQDIAKEEYGLTCNELIEKILLDFTYKADYKKKYNKTFNRNLKDES
jgi:hypothetical protein